MDRLKADRLKADRGKDEGEVRIQLISPTSQFARLASSVSASDILSTRSQSLASFVKKDQSGAHSYRFPIGARPLHDNIRGVSTMRWRGRRQSDNVQDRRGRGGGKVVGGGIGILILALVVGLLGGNPLQVLQQAQQVQVAPVGGGGPAELSAEDIERGEFVRTILADTEDVWNQLFAASGLEYEEPNLELFSQQTRSGCGLASSASGPFYCPADRKVYLDTAFFDQLARQLGAPGDFAQAYVVAHEVGHHVQNLLGKTAELDRIRGRVSQAEYNRQSVMLELQADFYAGVVFHHAERQKRILEPGDVHEGLRAAAAIGDDRLQKRSQGYANQESFTHGTSEQRVRWFRKGLETGDPNQGDTFNAPQL